VEKTKDNKKEEMENYILCVVTCYYSNNISGIYRVFAIEREVTLKKIKNLNNVKSVLIRAFKIQLAYR